MLSLDRYATVKHPRLAQLRERRFLPVVLAISAWLSAVMLCTPLLLVYRLSAGSEQRLAIVSPTNRTIPDAVVVGWTSLLSSSLTSSIQPQTLLPPPQPPDRHATNTNTISQAQLYGRQPPEAGTCYADYGTVEMHSAFTAAYACLVFVLPAIGVLLNHLGVRSKLCALSLTARAAHGELPLPMPILRRPTHMIIVTGMANAGRAVGGDADSCCGSADDDNDGDDDGIGGKADNDDDVVVVVAADVAAVPNGMGAPEKALTTTKAEVEPSAAADICAADEKRCMMAESRMRCNPRTPR